MDHSRKAWSPLPAWALHAVLAIATVGVSVAMFASGDPTSPYPLLFVCLATCAFCFLSRAEAVVYAAVIVAVYTTAVIVVAAHDTEHAAIRLGVLVVCLGVAATLLGRLRAKHNTLLARVHDLVNTDAATGLLHERGLDQAL